MKNNKRDSTWELFSHHISANLSKYENFVFLLTEKIRDTGFAQLIPDGKLFTPLHKDSNIIASASGIATVGKRPWIIADSFAVFLSAYKQIRDLLSVTPFPVTLVISDGGVSGGEAGVSYNILQDVALMRLLSNMNIFIPSDESTVVTAFEACAVSSHPSFLRLSRSEAVFLENDEADLTDPSGARIIKSGNDVTIFTCGTMLKEAMTAVEKLEKQGISTEVIDCYRVKPFPEQQLLSSVRKTGCCVVAEEHNSIGGLYSAVSECLSSTYPVPIRSVAVEDQYVNSGESGELREYYGLTWKEIVNAVSQVLALRRR